MKHNPFSLANKTILITGASSGIGRQCAISCSQLGARVILFGRNAERLAETQSLMENGKFHLIYPVDLTEFDKVEESVKELVLNAGKISGLINCAGISTTLPFNMVKPDKMDEFFRTNVLAGMNLTRIVSKQSNFSTEGGSVIFISSIMGEVGEVGKSLYSMTKGALIAGSRSLSLELASKKIRVNCISPGVVESPMSKGAVYSRNEESRNKIKALHPLGLGLPEDVANACVYLLSDASRWVTGTNLIVDGGYLAR
jgi:NAD(P)-dependent dehydrogenase (short-subunit alcohol dehydrogenase family)